jgi:CDP-4-dehydro-6-deoxyglucose reductase
MTEQLLSLARAARLVGVTRGALQRKLKDGELQAFEGMITLSELLRVFPGAEERMRADTMLERMEQIKASAASKAMTARVVLPDAEVLAARATSLSRELAESRAQAGRHGQLLRELARRLADLEMEPDVTLRHGLRALAVWLGEELRIPAGGGPQSQLLVKDTVLRIMAAHVRVVPSGHEFFVEGNDTILEAALRAGFALSYGCSNGNCGLCKAKILNGEIKKARPYDYVINEAEKLQGYALLCASTAVSDLVIEASEAQSVRDIPSQQIAARVKRTEPLTADMMLLHLQTPRTKRLRFLAGQHVLLEPVAGLVEEYPIASCPCDERNLQFHIRRRPGNTFTDYMFNKLKASDTVSVRGPTGKFVLQEDSPRSLIFIAWDTGFAPIKSLIEHAMALDVAERMHLYWISGQPNGHYLHNLCRSWADALDNFVYTPLTTELPTGETPGDVVEQRIEETLGHVIRDHSLLEEFDVYLAVPEALADASEFLLLDRGLPRTQLNTERCR